MALMALAPPPIGTIPQGLLGLLQLKETGKNPTSLADQVQPNLDITQLYLQRLINGPAGLFGAQIITSTLVNGNHGFQNLVNASLVVCVVPNNEMWLVYQWGCDVQTLAAADTLSGAPAIIPNPAQSRVILCAPIYADVVSSRVRSWASAPITTQFFAGPGTTFGVYLTDILTVGGFQVTSELRAVRIPI